MMDFISVPVVIAIIALGIYKLFELFVCKKERLMLIEKMGEIEAMPKFPLPRLHGNLSFSSSALKIGCLMLGMGMGLLVGYLICYLTIPSYLNSKNFYDYHEIISLIYGACVLGFGGAGLVAAFITELKLNRKQEKPQDLH